MFIPITVYQIMHTSSAGNVKRFSYPESTFYINPLQVVEMNSNTCEIKMIDGSYYQTDEEGLLQIADSEVCAYVTHNPIQ